jgi:DNA-binding MarR family transcriptional regulator
MHLPDRCAGPHTAQKHKQWLQHLKEMSSGRDIRGIEIAHSIRVLGRLIDTAVNQSPDFGELSGPRLSILLRLMGEEARGNFSGINPTQISHYQNVRKNTITSLLKGLEEHGLIERSSDPQDRRGFLIRITPAGRELVRSTAPARIEFMEQIVSSLSSDERDQLIFLLDKLRLTLIQKFHNPLDIETRS